MGSVSLARLDRDRLYRVSAVAEVLGVSKQSVYELAQRGELESLRIGQSVRITGDSIAEWVRLQAPRLYKRLFEAPEEPGSSSLTLQNEELARLRDVLDEHLRAGQVAS